jgi:hypothetical protein
VDIVGGNDIGCSPAIEFGEAGEYYASKADVSANLANVR